MTYERHALTDAPLKIRFTLKITGVQIAVIDMVEPMLGAIALETRTIVMNDKAYETEHLRTAIEKVGGTYCISLKSNQADKWECGWWQYKKRSDVECFFHRLK